MADLKVSDKAVPYGALGMQIEAHWRQYLPRTSKRLEKAGEFDDHVQYLEDWGVPSGGTPRRAR